MPGGRKPDKWQMLRGFKSSPATLTRTFSTSSPSTSSVSFRSTETISDGSSTSGVFSNPSNLSVRSATLAPNPYTILRIDNITSRMSLSAILRKLAPYAPNIVGISRTADYKSKRLGLTVYIYAVSNIDAVLLEHTFIDYREDGRDPQSMTIVDYKLGRARIMNTSYISRYDCIPVSIVINGLKRHKINDRITNYLADLLSFYESRGAVTSIRFNYDTKHSRSQNNGFVTFLSQQTAKALANDVTYTDHIIQGVKLSAKLSDGVPMLVKNEHYYMMPTGITVWTNEVEEMNMLIFRHHAPMVYPRQNEPDRHTGELQEQPTKLLDVDMPGDTTESDDESVSSEESTKCVHNLRGVTVPFEMGMSSNTIVVPTGVSTSGYTAPTGEGTSANTEKIETTSSDSPTKFKPKRPKIIIHEVRELPKDTYKLVNTPDGQTVVLQEDVELEDV